MPPFSLRRNLQASSLLAVLVGFGVLLVANGQLAAEARRQRLLEASEQVRMELYQRIPDPSRQTAQALLGRSFTPGRLLWLEVRPGVPFRMPTDGASFPPPVALPGLLAQARGESKGEAVHAFRLGGRSYLSTHQTLPLREGLTELWLLEDVTADTEREHTRLLLLLAAAGLTALLTSALLRLVMRRGLRPLDSLGARVEAFNAESLAMERLPLEGQPQELGPIVEAFNGLLDRLATERERQQAFVDGVAHELRTPITLISGYSQRLLRQGERRQEVASVASEAARMGRLVTDLLDIARDEAGRLDVRRSVIDIDDALLEAFERLSPLAEGRLRIQPPPEGPPRLAWGDADRLQQCLTNLVENALNYAPRPTPVELFASETDDEVIAHVRDYGPGVPEGEKERIFLRFVRGNAPPGGTGASKGSGSGIGLAVVKMLMGRMAGRIALTPQREGSRFDLALPRLKTTETPPANPPAPSPFSQQIDTENSLRNHE